MLQLMVTILLAASLLTVHPAAVSSAATATATAFVTLPYGMLTLVSPELAAERMSASTRLENEALKLLNSTTASVFVIIGMSISSPWNGPAERLIERANLSGRESLRRGNRCSRRSWFAHRTRS